MLELRAETIYRVKRGDTLTGIAQRHNVSVAELAARNGLSTADWISVGERLAIPAPDDKPEKATFYVVKRGESLVSIAQKFGITVADLVRANGIKKPDEIDVGDRLRVPEGKPAEYSGLGSELRKSLDEAVISKRWKNIVIHHSGSTIDTPTGMDRYHREERHMENGLAYHFVIGNGVRTKDGDIYIGHRWRAQLDGGHLSTSALNHVSIGICLIGDFNQRAPSKKQMESVRALIAYLMDRCDLTKKSVKMHRQINTRPTECPGSKFPTRQLLSMLP